MPTAEMFWSQTAAYNQATLPVQIVLILAGALVVTLIATGSSRANLVTKAFFALAFAWNGIVFFLLFAKSPFSRFVGAPLFLLTAALFGVDIRTRLTDFRLPEPGWRRTATICLIALTLLYPLAGYALGRAYPSVILPVGPCPLTTFAIALMTAAVPRTDRKAYTLLLVWALLGLPKCLGALDCREDCILFAAGLYGLGILVTNWRAIACTGGR